MEKDAFRYFWARQKKEWRLFAGIHGKCKSHKSEIGVFLGKAECSCNAYRSKLLPIVSWSVLWSGYNVCWCSTLCNPMLASFRDCLKLARVLVLQLSWVMVVGEMADGVLPGTR